MMVTLHLSDGRKITKDWNKLIFFDNSTLENANPGVKKGFITVNLNQVVDMRPAEPDEIEHAQIHGW